MPLGQCGQPRSLSVEPTLWAWTACCQRAHPGMEVSKAVQDSPARTWVAAHHAKRGPTEPGGPRPERRVFLHSGAGICKLSPRQKTAV